MAFANTIIFPLLLVGHNNDDAQKLTVTDYLQTFCSKTFLWKTNLQVNKNLAKKQFGSTNKYTKIYNFSIN